MAGEIRQAFARKYLTPSGHLQSDSQTAYALALEFGLLPEPAQHAQAAKRLVELVQASGYHIGTGFVGTPLICDALSNAGQAAEAYRLLLQRGCPSWLYPVTMGATTIWERWDSLLPDGSVNPGEMTSFNHYALGAVADWLHRVVGGLEPAEPGYRVIRVRPIPGGGIHHAWARHRTPYGTAECEWTIGDGEIEVRATIPPNTDAVVYLPGKETEPIEVGSGVYTWSLPYQHDGGQALGLEPEHQDTAF
jgi:alpha-L-rhamnosidase